MGRGRDEQPPVGVADGREGWRECTPVHDLSGACPLRSAEDKKTLQGGSKPRRLHDARTAGRHAVGTAAMAEVYLAKSFWAQATSATMA